MSSTTSTYFCVLTIRKQLPENRFERSGRGQEPSRGHKFSILENFLSIRDFTSAMRPHFRSDLVGVALVGASPLHLLSQTALPLKSPTGAFIAALRFANAVSPQTLLRTDEEELCQFDTIPPTIEKTERSRRGTPCCTYHYRLWLLAGCVWVGAPCFFTMLHHFLRAASGILHQHESGSDAAHPGIVPIFCAGMPCKLARKQCHFPAYCPILSA